MSARSALNAQRSTRRNSGVVSVAALLCLGAPSEATAQPAPTPAQFPAASQPAESSPPPLGSGQPGSSAGNPAAAPLAPVGTPAPSSAASQPLPTVSVESTRRRVPSRQQQAVAAPRTRAPAAASRAQRASVQPSSAQTAINQPEQTNAGGGTTIGYVGTSTSTATKTNTPLINVPQSVSVLTREFIRDQN